MQASSIPYKFKTPWGASATTPTYLTTPIPATSIGAAAGQDLGFPPATATDPSAGGTPPNINDVNGALNYATLWAQWLQAGAPVGYDATFSTNIGGYPKGAIIRSATAGQFWLSTVDNNTSDPDTGGANWVSAYSGRLLNIQTFATSGTYTPTTGTKTIVVEAIGGGGAGGGSPSTNSGSVAVASGGAAGSYARAIGAVPGSPVAVVIGAGGVGVSGGNGGSGGTTTFGSEVSCPGGGGGLPASTALTAFGQANQSAPGASPTITTLTVICASEGQPGLLGWMISGTVASGQGAPSQFGGGGPNTNTGNGSGAPGHGAGGGGGASAASSGASTGGGGGGGVVIITEYS